MDSLALPSRVSLTEELSALPTAALKAQLANTLSLTARHLMRLAVIVGILEDRGEDLSALKGGFLTILRKIAAGELLPDLVVLFAAEPAKIQQAAKLPVAEQERIASGRAALPDAKRRAAAGRTHSLESLGAGRIPEPTGGCQTPNPLRVLATTGNPRDIGETAAEMVLACPDRPAAVAFLLAALEAAGVKVGKAELARSEKPRAAHPPGYWLDQTKAAGES